MLRARNAHLNAAVNPSVQNVLHEQRVNILDDIFGQRPALRNTFLDICKSFSVIDYFIDLAQGLSAD